MALPDHRVFFGIALGALSALTLTAIGPGFVMQALAADDFRPFDSRTLVIFEDRPYSVEYEDQVSTEVQSQSTVRKIAFGKTSFVDITRTSTGTYSSEGLFSPHIRYPGIAVKALPYRVRQSGIIATLGADGTWSPLNLSDANSIIVLAPQD